MRLSLSAFSPLTLRQRDDVATTLAMLADRPDTHGLALDLVDGDKPIVDALDDAVQRGVGDAKLLINV